MRIYHGFRRPVQKIGSDNAFIEGVTYSSSEAKAHSFTGVDEADNWESLHARRHGWIFHVEMPNVYVIKSTMLTYVESGRHSDTQSEYT